MFFGAFRNTTFRTPPLSLRTPFCSRWLKTDRSVEIRALGSSTVPIDFCRFRERLRSRPMPTTNALSLVFAGLDPSGSLGTFARKLFGRSGATTIKMISKTSKTSISGVTFILGVFTMSAASFVKRVRRRPSQIVPLPYLVALGSQPIGRARQAEPSPLRAIPRTRPAGRCLSRPRRRR